MYGYCPQWARNKTSVLAALVGVRYNILLAMKQLFTKFIVLVMTFASLALASCTVKSTIPERTTAGDAYDVVVVANDDVWRGELSYAICDLLEASAPGLTRPQGYFNIVKHAAPERVSEIDRKYPNLLVVSINPAVAEASYVISNNVYARPQTILTITAPSVKACVDYVETNAVALREELERGERNNSNRYYAQRPAKELMADFKNHTGVEMVIPAGFFKANTRDKELLWYLRDYPTRAQYIFAFKSAVDPTLPVDMQALSVMGAVDAKLATISSKDAKGSYMRLSNEPQSLTITPDIDINGRNWLELRGWWEVAGDFMGGPFVGYVTIDEATSEALVVMFALYAPEDPQRNLLRELEHLIYTTK